MVRLSAFLAVAAVVCLGSLALAEEGKGPKLVGVSGEIAAIDGASITIVRKKDSGQTTETITTNADTKVLLPTDETEAGGEGGKKRKYTEGKVSDLKVGDRVRAECTEDKVAVKIQVQAPPAKKEGGEGKGDAAAAPKKPKEGGEG